MGGGGGKNEVCKNKSRTKHAAEAFLRWTAQLSGYGQSQLRFTVSRMDLCNSLVRIMCVMSDVCAMCERIWWKMWDWHTPKCTCYVDCGAHTREWACVRSLFLLYVRDKWNLLLVAMPHHIDHRCTSQHWCMLVVSCARIVDSDEADIWRHHQPAKESWLCVVAAHVPIYLRTAIAAAIMVKAFVVRCVPFSQLM